MGIFQRLFKKKKGNATQEDTSESKTVVPYHVSLNTDEKSANFQLWRVRKEKSSKTIKHFETQQAAIDYAKELADQNDTHIIIHKKDGTIRKQTY